MVFGNAAISPFRAPNHPQSPSKGSSYLRRAYINFFKQRSHTRTILIHIHEVSQLFNSFDPSPFHERDVDADAEEFITTVAEEIWHETGGKIEAFNIDIVLGELPTEDDYYSVFKKRLVSVEEALEDGLARPPPSPTDPSRVAGLPNRLLEQHKKVLTRKDSLIRYADERLARGNFFAAPSIGDKIAEELQTTMTAAQRERILQALTEDLQLTIRNHFKFQAQKCRNELKRTFRTTRNFLLMGFGIMVVCLLLARLLVGYGESLPANESGHTDFFDPKVWIDITYNALSILAWMAWWHPLEMFFYNWWPLFHRRRFLEKLGTCVIHVFQTHQIEIITS